MSSLIQAVLGPGSILNKAGVGLAATLIYLNDVLTLPTADRSKVGETSLFGLLGRFEHVDLVERAFHLWRESSHGCWADGACTTISSVAIYPCLLKVSLAYRVLSTRAPNDCSDKLQLRKSIP